MDFSLMFHQDSVKTKVKIDIDFFLLENDKHSILQNEGCLGRIAFILVVSNIAYKIRTRASSKKPSNIIKVN